MWKPGRRRLLLGGTLGFGLAVATSKSLTSPDCILYDWALSFMRKCLDPQTSHDISIWLASRGFLPVDYSINDPILHANIGPLTFYNPIGLAAGYDKQANATVAMLKLGFGFVEVGTIVPKPQPGNPKPVLFRFDKSMALVNRCGFNSVGLNVAARRLEASRQVISKSPLIKDSLVGVSVGKNRDGDIIDDVVTCINGTSAYADYLVLNVSSPNTPNLRDNQRKKPLKKLIMAAKDALNKLEGPWYNTSKQRPLLFIKVSPDLDDEGLDAIAQVALEMQIDGIVATNTTNDVHVLSQCLELEAARPKGKPSGGLSGRPLFEKSKQVVARVYKATGGKIPIIACGGISSGQNALEMIEAGATCCQIYSCMIYGGPATPSRIKRQLARLLASRGYKNIGQAVGSAHVHAAPRGAA